MKPSPAKAALIKADLAKAELTQPEIAKKHGVSRSLVSDIATGRAHKNVPWPEGYEPLPKKGGGQRKKIEDHDPTDARILELEADIIHLTEEKNRLNSKVKASAKVNGLFKAVIKEMEPRLVPFTSLPPARTQRIKKAKIKEHVVMHLSDGHHDQVITPEECGGLEEYNFPISCARAERYVDTFINWTQETLTNFDFSHLWILAYGDHTSGEIHNHAQRSYFRNQFKNCYAIGDLHALMIRDLAPYFEQVNVVYLPGNHGRRSLQKDFHGAHDNWDYAVAENTRRRCEEIKNVSFLIPDAFSCNLNINGVGFNLSHGDDVRGNLGIPFYGMVRRQKNLIALGSVQGGPNIRYFCMGHHHVSASLADINGELIVNGAWPGTDSYAFNSFAGYREPVQLVHGVSPEHGITWRLPIKLKHKSEKDGPKRYIIEGHREVGHLAS